MTTCLRHVKKVVVNEFTAMLCFWDQLQVKPAVSKALFSRSYCKGDISFSIAVTGPLSLSGENAGSVVSRSSEDPFASLAIRTLRVLF